MRSEFPEGLRRRQCHHRAAGVIDAERPAAFQLGIGIASLFFYVSIMSFAEIKQQIPVLAPDERLELAALIAHLSRVDDPQYQADLDRKLAAMEAGRKFTQADLERLHPESPADGR